MNNLELALNQALERLKFFRKTLHMTQREFADSINFSQGNYSRIESGKGQISFSLLYNLITIHGLNPMWLIMNQGDMLLKEDQTENILTLNFEDGKPVVTRRKGMEVNEPLSEYHPTMAILEKVVFKLVEEILAKKGIGDD